MVYYPAVDNGYNFLPSPPKKRNKQWKTLIMTILSLRKKKKMENKTI